MTDNATSRGLLDVEAVYVPWKAVETAHDHLRTVGEEGAEGLALWAGVRDGNTFQVRETIIPEQTAHATREGVCVTVGSAELRRIGVWLYERGYQIVAQLHSHPGAAYHSATDDHFAVATTAGALSLVVPDYARRPFALERCAAYRLTQSGMWSPVSQSELTRLIHILAPPATSDAADDSSTTPTADAGKERKWHWLRSLTRRP